MRNRLPISGNVPADLAEILNDILRPEELPDFTSTEYVRQVVDDELVPAIVELMTVFQVGKNGSHEALLRACAMVERALLQRWRDL